jgi:undecaprenyl-diphosphatase
LNDYVLSFFLGIIEGITEFLPVSSTAHLRLVEKLCHDYGLAHINLETGYWKMYTIVIQLGAVLCLPVYFRKRIATFLKTFPQGEGGNRNVFNHPLTLTLIAFAVTALPAFLLSKTIGENLDNFYVIGGALLIGGAVMWAVDALFVKPTTLHMEEMSLPQAIWIGAAQILSAVFPGTSRSMATIAAGQTAGMSRAAALEFSFFLSMPTMLAATLFALKKALFPKHPPLLNPLGVGGAVDPFSPGHMTPHEWIILLIGFVTSFFVAWAVVAWFMTWVRRRGFVPFAIYRIILGLVVLIWIARH